MATDNLISSRMVLRALTQVQRDRGKRAMQQIEEHEPALAEFVFEQLTDIHRRLWAAGLSDRVARRLFHQIQQLVLTAVVAQRQAHADAWDEQGGDPDSATERGP